MKAYRTKLGSLLGGVVILTLVVFNLLLLQENQALKGDLSRFSRISQRSEFSPSFSPLLSAGTQPFCFTFVDPESGELYEPKLALLVFFSIQDCASCLQEASIWQRLQDDFHAKGLKVLGFAPSSESLKMNGFAEAESLSFPIAYVESVYMKRRIGIRQTPFKVLLDSTLTVVYLNGPNSELEDQLRFKDVIERWCALSL